MTKPRRLWVDDERPTPEPEEGDGPPPYAWSRAMSSPTAINRLVMWKSAGYEFLECSLDHDLGGEDTGMLVLNWMIENNYWPKVLTIHTQNRVGRENLLRAANAEAPPEIDIYIRFW